MTYVDYEDVIARYSIIKTWGKSETEVTSDLIYFAEVELNGRLASHFSVPFAVAHPTVKDLTIDLCYYKALVTKDPEKAKLIHDAVIGRINDIKGGKEYIYTGSGTVIPSGAEQEVWSTVKDYHPVHSMLDAESGYTQVDSSLIEDLEDERS
jgi:hypothetical protein